MSKNSIKDKIVHATSMSIRNQNGIAAHVDLIEERLEKLATDLTGVNDALEIKRRTSDFADYIGSIDTTIDTYKLSTDLIASLDYQKEKYKDDNKDKDKDRKDKLKEKGKDKEKDKKDKDKKNKEKDKDKDKDKKDKYKDKEKDKKDKSKVKDKDSDSYREEDEEIGTITPVKVVPLPKIDNLIKRSSIDSLGSDSGAVNIVEQEERKKLYISSCIKMSVSLKCGKFVSSKDQHIYDDIVFFSEDNILKRMPIYNAVNWYRPVVSNYRVENLEYGVKVIRWEEKYVGRFDLSHTHHITEYEASFYRGKIIDEDIIIVLKDGFNNLYNDLMTHRKNIYSSNYIIESYFLEVQQFVKQALNETFYSEDFIRDLRDLKKALNDVVVVKSKEQQDALLAKQAEETIKEYYKSGQYYDVYKNTSSVEMKKKALIKLANTEFLKQNFAESFKYYRKALDLFDNKNDFKYYGKLASCLNHEGFYKEALKNAEIALEINVLDLEAKKVKKDSLVHLIDNQKKHYNPNKDDILEYYNELIDICSKDEKPIYLTEAGYFVLSCDADNQLALKFALSALSIDEKSAMALSLVEKCENMGSSENIFEGVNL